MDGEYDAIVLGTGLAECIISGILARGQMRILHVDRNEYYGGDDASLNMSQIRQRCDTGPDTTGDDTMYYIDLSPRFIMADGPFMELLNDTGVIQYLELREVDESFVHVGGKLIRVPVTEMEALKSPLFGVFEKIKVRRFFEFIRSYNTKNPPSSKLDLEKVTMRKVYQHFGLSDETCDMIEKMLVLHNKSQYMDQPAIETCNRTVQYFKSMSRHGKTPYAYPAYGIGELAQGFARLSAVNGTVYILNANVTQAITDENGNAAGVEIDGKIVKAPIIIGSPSYFPDYTSSQHKIIRVVCILDAPIPHTANSHSLCIIVYPSNPEKKTSIYIKSFSHHHRVCPKNTYIAYVSTVIETIDPVKEVEPALKLLGQIRESFVLISTVYKQNMDASASGIYITNTYENLCHLDDLCSEMQNLYRRITKKPLSNLYPSFTYSQKL